MKKKKAYQAYQFKIRKLSLLVRVGRLRLFVAELIGVHEFLFLLGTLITKINTKRLSNIFMAPLYSHELLKQIVSFDEMIGFPGMTLYPIHLTLPIHCQATNSLM